MSSQSHLSYHPAAELKEALPDHLLLYALGYFGLITPVTRHELAARFTCPTNNSQARRGSTKLIMKREAKLIDQLMRPGENGALWRRTHRDRASRYGSLFSRMPAGLTPPDMAELRRRIRHQPNPWTGVNHVEGIGPAFDPNIHHIVAVEPSNFVRGSLAEAEMDEEEMDEELDAVVSSSDDDDDNDPIPSLPVPQHWTVPDDAFELTLPEALRLNDAIHVSEIGRYMRLYQCAFTGARDMILVEFWGGQRPAHMGYRFDPNAG